MNQVTKGNRYKCLLSSTGRVQSIRVVDIIDEGPEYSPVRRIVYRFKEFGKWYYEIEREDSLLIFIQKASPVSAPV
jgi:hypothetical protein